jgi:hypothetical protein
VLTTAQLQGQHVPYKYMDFSVGLSCSMDRSSAIIV